MVFCISYNTPTLCIRKKKVRGKKYAKKKVPEKKRTEKKKYGWKKSPGDPVAHTLWVTFGIHGTCTIVRKKSGPLPVGSLPVT